MPMSQMSKKPMSLAEIAREHKLNPKQARSRLRRSGDHIPTAIRTKAQARRIARRMGANL